MSAAFFTRWVRATVLSKYIKTCLPSGRPATTRQAALHGPRHSAAMGSLPIPDFGNVVGLRRLYRAAVERIRQSDIPEAHKRAWIEELTRHYRVTTQTGSPGASAMSAWDGGK